MKGGDIIYCEVPDHSQIHLRVLMNQNITESGKFLPGNLRIEISDIIRNILRGFSGYLKESNDSSTVYIISKEFFKGNWLDN